jgi:hypothetical protein
MAVDARALARRHAVPAVTVLLALDARLPGSGANELRVRRALDEAVAQLERRHPRAVTATVADRLRDAARTLDLLHPAPGLALLATPDASHVVVLPGAPRERIAVGEHFALAELVDAVARAPRARVLVLAFDLNRCFLTVDGGLEEQHGDGFPVTVSPPRQADTPHRDFPLGEHESAEAHRAVARAVDDALGRLQARERFPVVLVGTERDVAYFDEVTRHGTDVVGRLHGNHVRETAPVLARLVAPVLDAHRARRHEETVRHVLDAIGTRAVAGAEPVARAARAGRGALLLVERDADDADEVVETVLAHGGDVLVVAPGALAAAGGIALSVRY